MSGSDDVASRSLQKELLLGYLSKLLQLKGAPHARSRATVARHARSGERHAALQESERRSTPGRLETRARLGPQWIAAPAFLRDIGQQMRAGGEASSGLRL